MFDCFLLILLSLSLLQLFQIVVLSSCPLLEVVSLCLQLHDQIPELLRLHLQVLRVHPIKLERPYSNTERNLFLFLQLLLGLGHLSPDVHHISHPFILLLVSLSASCRAQLLPLLLGLLGLLLSLFFPHSLLLFLLLLGQLLLLLCPDLLPLGLLLFQLLQLLLLLGPLLPPLIDVLLQLLVKFPLLSLPSGLEKVSLSLFRSI